MARLFISHSSRNNDKAIEVRDWLAANGWDDVFLDLDPERGIVAGQRWKEALQQAATRCEVVLALVSAEWLASGWCKSEIDAARLIGKKIIVALIGIDKSQVPLDLLDEQYIDLSGDPQAYPRLKEGLKHAGLDPLSFPFEPGRRPYPGFAYFEERDVAVFFGRDAQIVRGLDEFRRLVRTGVTRMLVILGASGSGKSSFLRAGLWPRLKRDDRAWLPLPIIRPERAVISGTYGLTQALQQIIAEPRFAPGIRRRGLPHNRPDIEDFIKTEGGLVTLFDALRDIGQVPGLSGEDTSLPTIALALDQGEELFNEEGRDEAERFVEILTRTLKADPRTLAILAMRSDSFPLVQAHPGLAALPKDTFALDRMLEGSYRAVIEEPARLIQPTPLRIDPQLTDALLEETSGQDALPLLAFTLARLFENYAADNELTLAGYDRLGRVKGVIDTAVKKALAAGVAKGELPKDAKGQLALARAAFIPHLAQVSAAGQFMRRVATRDQIPAEARPVIDSFAEQRLLIKDRRKDADRKDADVVEVAHEALLRQPPFSEWLEEDREFLVGKQHLQNDLRDWQEANPADKNGALLTGLKLSRVRAWLAERPQDFTEEERDFGEASIRQADADERRKARQRRIITRASIAAAVVLACFAVAAGWQWRLAKQEKLSALIEASNADFAANEYWDALLTSLRASHNFRTLPLLEHFDPQIRSQIVQSVQQALYGIKEYKRLEYKIASDVSRPSAVGQIDWSPNGTILAFLSGQDKVTLWRPDSNSLRSIHLNRGTADKLDSVQSIGWRPPNGTILAISTAKGYIEFFDSQGNRISPAILPTILADPGDSNFYGISWRPDGQELALASFNHGVMVLRPDGTQLDSPLNLKQQVWSVAWSPAPQHLLAAGGFPGTVMWQTPYNSSSPCHVQLGPWIESMSWRPDGKSLAVGLRDGTVRLLSADCTESEQAPGLTGRTGPVSGVSWSSDRRLVTASEQDGTVTLWDKEGMLMATFPVPTVQGGVQWRPHGKVFATVDRSGLVRLWTDNPRLETLTGRAHAAVTDAALSPDGRILASASNESINLWRQDQHGRWPSEPHPLQSSSGMNSLSWSPDGRLLASTSYDAVTIWHRDGTVKQTLKHQGVGNGVLTVSWNRDSKELATGDGYGYTTLWDISDGAILSQRTCGDWAQTIAWNPADDRLLAVGCHNRAGAYLLEWKPDKKEIRKTQLLKETAISGVSWSHDGKFLATSGNDRINLWRRDGKLMRTLDTSDEVGKVAWSPDNQMLAVASRNVVKLFKVVKSSEQDDRPITVLRGHTGAVKSVTWNKQTLVSASTDGTVKLWQIDKGFANNPLDTLLAHSCKWLEGYLERNPLVDKEDSDLQDLCSTAWTAAAPSHVPPTNEKALPAPARLPAEIKPSSVHQQNTAR